jgi:hypothetical protein
MRAEDLAETFRGAFRRTFLRETAREPETPMLLWPKTVTRLAGSEALIRRGRYGVIQCASGAFERLRLRVLPTVVTIDEACWWGPLARRFDARDRCRLFYNQPLGHGRFLALKYAISGRACTLRTFQSALATLEAIAAIKQIDAIVCQVWNARLTPRVMGRFGWTQHTSDPRGRHFIKRFCAETSQNSALRTERAER